jgi:SAM-dependent methyltransferase
MSAFFRRIATPPQILLKQDTIEAAAARNGVVLWHVLNIGSKDVRVGDDCVNFDIVSGPCVDIVGDAHDLTAHFARESFDTVVLSAVLQYCEDPRRVLEQARDVLRPGGWLFLDAPFLQPYYYDGPDLWRFTGDGLRRLCAHYLTIVEISVSIATIPALADAAQTAARRVGNRYAATALAWTISGLLWPLRRLPMSDPGTAGAFLLVARRPS